MTTQATELETVQQAMKQTKDKRMHERYQAVSLFLQGYTYAQITKIVGRNEKDSGRICESVSFFLFFWQLKSMPNSRSECKLAHFFSSFCNIEFSKPWIVAF
ncbi:hypothetical protein GCM10020331_025560 [Ectobacillus funiculus]